MKVNSVEKNGNKATVVVEIDKELMESGVNKAYLKARKKISVPGFQFSFIVFGGILRDVPCKSNHYFTKLPDCFPTLFRR